LERLVIQFRTYGYRLLEPMVLNACAFGVPQDRRRLFLIGARDGEPLPEAPSPTTRGRGRRPGSPIPTAANFDGLPPSPSVSDAIGDLPDIDRFRDLLESDHTELAHAKVRRLDAAASEYVRLLRQLDDD